MRLAPAAIIARASFKVRIPPAALTPMPGPPTQRIRSHVFHGGTAGTKTGRSLQEIRPGCFCEKAGEDLLTAGQQGGLDDHLEAGAALVGFLGDEQDIVERETVRFTFERPDIDHHVHFVGTFLDCTRGPHRPYPRAGSRRGGKQ